jgi:hypothetical protein
VDHSTYEYAKTNIEQIEHNAIMTYVLADSAEVGRTWIGNKVDLLIVDADHRYEGVKKDIEAWWPHVKRRGFLFFHDYLEREGGFHGTGDWTKGEVAKAINRSQTSSWHRFDTVGISVIYEKWGV